MPRPKSSPDGDVVGLRRADATFVSAAVLGAVLAGRRIQSPSELGALLVRGGTVLQALLDIVLAVRQFQRPSRPRTSVAALAELRGGTPSTWVVSGLRLAFGLYNTLRRAAKPKTEHGTKCGHVLCVVGWF